MMLHKKPLFALCLSVAALAAFPLNAAKDFLDANWDSYSGIQVDTNAVLPEKETHPSLWFTRDQLIAFKKTLNADPTIAAYWEKVRNHKFLTSPFPEMVPADKLRVKELASANNKQIHKYYGDMTQIPLYCSFMAWMTDDADLKQQYIERAKTALLRSFDGPIYELDPTEDGVDKSVDEIYRAIWSQSICAAYDFIQPFLTKAEDAKIRARLLKEAHYTHENLMSWASGPHNHLSKPAWGLAAYALAFSEEPEASSWFQRAMEAANQNTKYHFSSDGIYREGGMYYVFSWLNFVPFLYHYKNVSGVDYFDEMKEAFEWGIIGRNAKGWTMNIEDAFIRPVPTQMVSRAFQNHRSFLAPEKPFSEVLQWNFQTTDYVPFQNIEKISGYNYTGATWDYPKELYELITYDPTIKASAPTVDPTIFMDGGQSFFRNSWTNDPEEQFYLLFHGVPQADNHDHHDTLSFVMYAKNQMMASDAGYTRSSYGDKKRYSYYRRPQAHNTITFDDIPLGDFVENQPNPSENRLNTSFFDLEKKSAPFRRYLGEELGSAKRTIAFIQSEYFLVLDEAKGPQNSTDSIYSKFDVYFHGGRAKLSQKDGTYIWSYGKDNYGSEVDLLTYQLAPEAEIEVFQAESTYIKGDYEEFPALRTQRIGKEALFGQILYPLGSNDKAPVIENLSSKELLGAKITTDAKTDLFLKSFTEKNRSLEGLSANGDFAWIRLVDGKPEKAVGQSIKYFTYQEKNILTTNKRVSFALSLDDTIEFGVDIEAPTRVELRLDESIRSIKFGDEEIPFKIENGVVFFTPKKSGNYFLK